MPDICVLMSVYNSEKTLDRAIQSILNQSLVDFEFVLIEDGSNDGGREMIRGYAARDSRIRAIYHDGNQGLTASLNEGVLATECEFIARMDADDESLPSRLQIQYDFMRSHPEIAVAGTYAFMMGVTPRNDRLLKLPVTDAEIRETLARENCIFHPSVMMRRARVLEAGLYRPEFRSAQDYDLWLRMSRMGFAFANVPEALIRYRFSIRGITLDWKWEQLYYVHLAQLCFQRPDLNLETARERAGKRLRESDKSNFLKGVARGTCKELIQLGYSFQAAQLLWKFGKDMGLVRTLQALGGIFMDFHRRPSNEF